MGAKKLRRLPLAAAAGALLASGAAADIYSYDSYWTYDLPAYYSAEPFVSADSSGVVIPVNYSRGIMSIWRIYCYRFSGSGAKTGEVFVWNNTETENPVYAYGGGLITLGRDVVVAYDIERIYHESALFRGGTERWEFWERSGGFFRVLARPINGTYFFNYRRYSGGMRVCKCRGDSTVISYFTPAGGVDDIAVDGNGYVYIADDTLIRKYTETGSLHRSWPVPSSIKDLTVDKWQRLLALARDKYTYVYNTQGGLLGSFTANYLTDIYSADVGPGNQYYVMGDVYSNGRVIYVYRFTPDTSAVIPASLGKIKTMYH